MPNKEQQKNHSVIVVEDEGIVALDLCQLLESYGYQVLCHVSSGEEAVEKVAELKPSLVLMDINLAGKMDGVQAATIIHQASKTPIIFLTAHADEATLARAKFACPVGYILKPFEAAELRASIETALFRIESLATGEIEEEDDEASAFEADEKDLIRVLSSVSLFKKCTPANIESLVSSTRIRSLDSGENLFEAQQRHEFGFVVLTGRLSVLKATRSGKELAVDVLPPGDVYGIVSALSGSDQDAFIRAQVPSKVIIFPRTALVNFASNDSSFSEAIYRDLGRRLSESHDFAISLAHAKVESRVAECLINLADRIGKEGQTKGQPRIYLTRRELADLTGTTSETAIRVTKVLERQGLLDLTKPGIIKILSLSGLKEAIAS